MHITLQNLIHIQSKIKEKINILNYDNYKPEVIAVSKTFKMDHISPLIDYGHRNFGENKVQETLEKWSEIKLQNPEIQLHMLGKLQTNKVKQAIRIFDYIHSVDSIKLAQKIHNEQEKINRELKLFIQVNIGRETQKSGIEINELDNLVKFCNNNSLNVVGLMCLPPYEKNSGKFFKEIKILNDKHNFKEISMGMSHDYLDAIEFKSTHVRIGSKIFGNRT